ncbi:MAG: helix-turn-helix transcriptional regulator [Lachnospiraceae bacterium]|nr:helix-turn-helix transcriptional regulator [Lachnospiraceae bacterium]
MNRKMIRFGENIRILRNKKGWTQEQLANEVHVARQTVSAWEKKVSYPDINILARLHEIFEVTADELIFGKMPYEYQDVPMQDIIYGQEEIIRSIKKKGFYDILEEDIQEFFPIIYLRFPRIMGIVLELHELGYQICSVYSNGFSIYFSTDEEAEKFSGVLYDMIDAIMHDNVKRTILTYSEKVQDRVDEVEIKVLQETHKLIFDDEMEHMYYWVDKYDRIRGYGKTVKECKVQAKEQACDIYTIMHE